MYRMPVLDLIIRAPLDVKVDDDPIVENSKDPSIGVISVLKQGIFLDRLNKTKKGSFDSTYRGITMSILVFYHQ